MSLHPRPVTRFARRRSAALHRLGLIACAAVTVTACSSGASQAKAQDAAQPTDSATPLTPSAANAELAAVMLAVAHAALPTGDTPSVQDPKVGSCGGTIEATVAKVTTAMELESSAADPGRTAVQMRDAALAYLKSAGWRLSAPQDNGGEYLGFATLHGQQLQVSASDADKGVTVLGNTPCLDDVQATPAG